MPLSKLRQQFESNLAALRLRDPALADQLAALKPESDYFLSTQADKILLARRSPARPQLELLHNPAPPAKAREVIAQIFPNGHYTQPILIAGLDQGWLWDALYKLKCACPHAPGMRPPLYLITSQIERLWVVLHYQNWTALLADSRTQLIVAPNAAAQLESLLAANPRLAEPKLDVTVEPALWLAGENLNAMLGRLNAAATGKLADFHDQMAAFPCAFAGGSSRPLRVMGITSRYTSFLQHSMRDWLAALEKLGHQTRLLIEQQDHEILPALIYAQECQAFRPDLILIIDHHRAELAGLPRNVPCVMWVQDRMPHIYRADSGAAQGPLDYVIGYGRQECILRCGYPAARFMPAMVGVNEDRFDQRPLTPSELADYACDVAFVSHASVPADQIIQQEIARSTSPNARKLLDSIYQRLRHIYDAGNSITETAALQPLIQSALDEHGFRADLQPLMDLVSLRVNNALLRHQSIRWIADMGVDLRLYGRGWEAHPEFKSYARGIADNQNQLAIIYRASRINLQVTPFGSCHQRLFEGLGAGGFFLLRAVTGESIDQLRVQLWDWCRANHVHDSQSMIDRGTDNPAFINIVNQISQLSGDNPLADPAWFYAGLEEAAMAGFSRSASTLWPEYADVSFWTAQQLTEKVRHYLSNADQRRAIARSMRQAVLQWHTYTAISRRMLSFIEADLARKELAAAA